MNWRFLPNLITITRILLVIPIVWLLIRHAYAEAFIIFFIAGCSDAVDGYLARRNHWFSRLGSILDPIADKLLMFSVFVALGWLGITPMWLVLIVVARDVIIIFGALAYHGVVGKYDMEPSLLSKLNTLFQACYLLAAILVQFSNFIPAQVTDVFLYAVAVTTVLSGLDYVVVWGRRAVHAVGRLKQGHD